MGERVARTLAAVLVCLFLITVGGCARLPGTVTIPAGEKAEVIALFQDMVARQMDCPCCIDAEATVSFSSIWQKGSLSGYLQAMTPSYLKFVGINPFGQPLAIFVTDGELFRYVAVPATKEYSGNVAGTTYARYAPEGFLPRHGFYWLIGRLYPGEMKILDVGHDEEGNGYWFTLNYANGTTSLVLFAETQGVLRRHIVLDENGKRIFNVLYDDYSPGLCPMPGKITVTSLVHNSSMELRLSGRLPDASFTGEDFQYEAPPSFERVLVE
ncbi:MAG: hypothetical protein V1706_16515 [Pseudomonadota bacterium]